MALARISITAPSDLIEEADRRARALDRSRSWVVAEALRLYLQSPPAREDRPGRKLQERARVPYLTSGLGAQRTAQLEADLALTPEQRVREAERTLELSELSTGSWRGQRLLMFDRYEDYLAWQRWAELAPA